MHHVSNMPIIHVYIALHGQARFIVQGRTELRQRDIDVGHICISAPGHKRPKHSSDYS